MNPASFLLPPEPLTSRQRVVFWATALLVAATRIWALSRSMWEWDEGLFALAVRDYDVVDYRPHPPGFPLYIGAAKLLRILIESDFRALQMVTLLGALVLFPATFLLARELHFSFATSLLASLLYVFAPNVWYYGGTAFSDIPATTAVIAANALLLRGCREARSYLGGALLLGASLGLRPHLLLAGLASFALASLFQFRKSRPRVLAAVLIATVVVSASYLGAAAASASMGGYFRALIEQGRYVGAVDSFLSSTRPALQDLVVHVFVKAVRAPRMVALFICVFAIIAVVASIPRRAANVWLLILMFAPLNVFSWLMLDIGATSRYAVSYAAMYALLAAEGAKILTDPLKAARVRALGHAVLVLVLTGHLIVWALPGINQVRASPAPPTAAIQWLVKNAPRESRIHMSDRLEPLARYYLSDYDVVFVPPMQPLPTVTLDRKHYFVIDRLSPYPGSQNFSYRVGTLWQIARARFFAASVLPLETLARFGDGWYDVETDGTTSWRWMSSRGLLILSPMDGPASLMLQFHVPPKPVSQNPTVTLTFNGEVAARQRVGAGLNTMSVTVAPRADRENEAVIAIDRTITPVEAGDPRELGLQLFSWSWSPVPPSPR